MWVNKSISVKGCITQEKYIRGKSLTEIERILGFHNGRLNFGVTIAALTQIPLPNQFDLLGYTQVAEHRFDTKALSGLDVDKLKDTVFNNVFTLYGINRLIKVIPTTGHQTNLNNDEQYPPGQGVPQWKLIVEIPAKVIAIISPGDKYI